MRASLELMRQPQDRDDAAKSILLVKSVRLAMEALEALRVQFMAKPVEERTQKQVSQWTKIGAALELVKEPGVLERCREDKLRQLLSLAQSATRDIA